MKAYWIAALCAAPPGHAHITVAPASNTPAPVLEVTPAAMPAHHH